MKRSAIMGLAAAGIAALATSSAKAEEFRPEVKAAVVACMLLSDQPRPFKVTDAKDWNDFRFVDMGVKFYNDEALAYYKAKCMAIAYAVTTASMQEQSGLSQLELVRCMIKQSPDLVEGNDGEKRDYIRRPNLVEYTTPRAADAGKKCTTELRKK